MHGVEIQGLGVFLEILRACLLAFASGHQSWGFPLRRPFEPPCMAVLDIKNRLTIQG